LAAALPFQHTDHVQGHAQRTSHAEQEVAVLAYERRLDPRYQQSTAGPCVPDRREAMTGTDPVQCDAARARDDRGERGVGRPPLPEADRRTDGLAEDDGAHFGVELFCDQLAGAPHRAGAILAAADSREELDQSMRGLNVGVLHVMPRRVGRASRCGRRVSRCF